jgi:hypothetical protein
MRPFEQDWLELGRRVVCSLHYQHPRNLRLVGAAQADVAVVAEELGPSLRWATATTTTKATRSQDQ